MSEQPTTAPHTPPHDLDAETCVLGSMLMEPQARDKAATVLSAVDFYRPSHRTIFATIMRLHEQGHAVDLVTVGGALRDAGQLDNIGGGDQVGMVYLDALADGVPWAGHVATYAATVKTKARLRGMLEQCERTQAQALDPSADPDVLADELRASIDREQPDRTQPTAISAADLLAQSPEQPEPIMDGLLRRREVMNIISGPKANKSWLVMLLALSIVTGRDFLGFPTRPGRVLLFDFELAMGTLAKRLQAVASSLGLSVDDLGDRLQIVPLRGKRFDVHAVGRYLERIGPEQCDLIIADPLFKMYPADLDGKKFDENSNADVAALYGLLTGIAERADAALVVVHHASKGNQADRATTDMGAGAGAQSRACDVHLAIRPHAEAGAAIVSAVVRSFPPVVDFAMRWTYPVWELAPELDPAAFYKPVRKNAKTKAEAGPPPPPKPSRDTAWLVHEVLSDKPKTRDAIVALAIEAGVPNQNQAKRLLTTAEATGKAYRWSVPKDNRAFFCNIPQPILEAQ